METSGINGAIEGGLTSLHGLMEGIRKLIGQFAQTQLTLVLLLLAGVGGWYLAKKYPQINGYWVVANYTLLIFLLLKYL